MGICLWVLCRVDKHGSQSTPDKLCVHSREAACANYSAPDKTLAAIAKRKKLCCVVAQRLPVVIAVQAVPAVGCQWRGVCA
mmetsp:Transcript_98153/g.227624  ORF Transcript_98153/g.227624 Transcript_98153/m.227624 type:complete len:81 (-) Transcript_98153:232-474(-)